ncbi:MAG: SDR family oxidoreductase [Anaerolineales bacterium]|jgi:NAD(P)-dependent dehydrogenase (short-subunit alcohol dehydrogenase family)
MEKTQRVALVTGANRGLGFEVCRQLAQRDYQVILASRDTAKGLSAVQKLKDEGHPVLFQPMDVTQASSVAAIGQFLEHKFGCLDVLVNNAGIYLRREDEDITTVSIDTLERTVSTNAFGALRASQMAIPLMRKNAYGRLVNVSSTMGQLSRLDSSSPAYRLSKAIMNALTRMLADATRGTDILVNACAPGWIKTDMGGPGAHRSVEQGADTIVWLATLPSGGPSGAFFQDRKQIEW